MQESLVRLGWVGFCSVESLSIRSIRSYQPVGISYKFCGKTFLCAAGDICVCLLMETTSGQYSASQCPRLFGPLGHMIFVLSVC